jgi:hypothetical protein
MKTVKMILICGLSVWAGQLFSSPTVIITQGEETDLAATYDTGDLNQGLIATELPGDRGWHSVNTDPADRLPAFTDGVGMRATGLTGLLNDFPGANNPAKLIQYVLRAPADITELRVFTGNNGRDGRVFHTYTVRFSTDGALTFTTPIYVQSHASGSLNNSSVNQWRVVLSQLTESAGLLASRVTHVELDFFAVDNTQGEMRDPFDGANPFTGLDDSRSAAFVSPLVWEIDLLGHYSPPILAATRVGNNLDLSWVGLTNGATLQATTNLDAPAWLDLSPQPAISSSGNTNNAQVSIESGNRYLRVRY